MRGLQAADHKLRVMSHKWHTWRSNNAVHGLGALPGSPRAWSPVLSHGSSKLQTSVARTIKALHPCMGSPL